MKRNKYPIVISSLVIIGLAGSILNLRVTYYQGVNYEVRIRKIPLYLKIIDLFSRHYHYKELTKEIVKDCKTQEDKVFAIFDWTYRNVKKVPESFPLIDDHVWNIIVRGYGTDDQSADVFATLSTYAGFPATWIKLYPKDSQLWIAAVVVKLNRRYIIFDPFRGNYFMNKEGKLASIEDMMRDNSIVYQANNRPVIYGIKYAEYFNNLSSMQKLENSKARQQMVLPRLFIEIKKMLRKLGQ